MNYCCCVRLGVEGCESADNSFFHVSTDFDRRGDSQYAVKPVLSATVTVTTLRADSVGKLEFSHG